MGNGKTTGMGCTSSIGQARDRRLTHWLVAFVLLWACVSQAAAQDWTYQGYRMTIFSEPEEVIFESSLKGDKIRYYPGQAMSAAGGELQYAEAWQPKVVVDRELITGQNPFSDHLLAKTLIEALNAQQ